MANSSVKRFGILTSGGDCPGLNAAIRSVVQSASAQFGMEAVGIFNGYSGLIECHAKDLHLNDVADIASQGGTILGTSREKPFKLYNDFTEHEPYLGIRKPELIKQNMTKLNIDALVVIGGNGTNTTAHFLAEQGLNIIGIPKTIDNDVFGTDISLGFDSAVHIATEAIERLQSTARSHNRVMLIELMGHKAGWIALHAGIAGGSDVIVIPEIPYDSKAIIDTILHRKANGKNFSIIAVAEGALSIEEALLPKKKFKEKRNKHKYPSIAHRIAHEIESEVGLETRATVLGYLQRGGTPSAYDRILAANFGAKAAEMLAQGLFGHMVTMNGNSISSIPLKEVANKTRVIPSDFYMLKTSRNTGICIGV